MGKDSPTTFDPNAPGNKDAGIFGLPFTPEDAGIVLFPVPWEVTVSYNGGTSEGPGAILNSSYQVDLFDEDLKEIWKVGIAIDDLDLHWKNINDTYKKKAGKIIDALESGKGDDSEKLKRIRTKINEVCGEMNAWVEMETTKWLDKGKLVGLIGGDHSTPLGYIRALAKRHSSFGILHLDAHLDLRNAYEGFEFSHASIMFNSMKLEQVSKLVSVGIRDFCEEESDFVANSNGRAMNFTWRSLENSMIEGKTWKDLCKTMVDALPDKVYLSFDIDGLDPTLCPNTGTPVPGGMSFNQALYIIRSVVESGRKIIGFDIVEVCPGDDDWDGNVGARMLYSVCGWVGKSNGLI